HVAVFDAAPVELEGRVVGEIDPAINLQLLPALEAHRAVVDELPAVLHGDGNRLWVGGHPECCTGVYGHGDRSVPVPGAPHGIYWPREVNRTGPSDGRNTELHAGDVVGPCDVECIDKARLPRPRDRRVVEGRITPEVEDSLELRS